MGVSPKHYVALFKDPPFAPPSYWPSHEVLTLYLSKTLNSMKKVSKVLHFNRTTRNGNSHSSENSVLRNSPQQKRNLVTPRKMLVSACNLKLVMVTLKSTDKCRQCCRMLCRSVVSIPTTGRVSSTLAFLLVLQIQAEKKALEFVLISESPELSGQKTPNVFTYSVTLVNVFGTAVAHTSHRLDSAQS